MLIDWKVIAAQVGDLNSDGSELGSGTESGIRALELIVGEENIRGAVDLWTSFEPGYETAEKTLLVMQSSVAMEYCYEIYKNEPKTQRAERAIFLLSEMANWHFVRWAREFMEDTNPGIRWNATVALEQVLEGPLDDEGVALAKELLAKAEEDSDPRLRERAQVIYRRLASNPRLKHLDL